MLSAMRIAYGKKVNDRGPVYKSFTVDGKKVNIKFANPGTGLETLDNGTVKGFMVAGSDSVFLPGRCKN